MTTTADETGTVVFFGALTIPLPGPGFRAEVMKYGSEIPLSEALRAVGTDRVGACWLDLLDDPDGQRKKWGKVLFARGPWPADKPRIEVGSFEWQEEYETRRADAWRITDDRQRAERLALVDKAYGGMPTTSRTVQTYGYRGKEVGGE